MHTKLTVLILVLFSLGSCKDSSPEPIDEDSNQVTDSTIYNLSGGAQLILDDDATATITLIGGGAGGGGGSKNTGSNSDMTTGGGGGGGAGEIQVIKNVQLKAGVTYVIFVGKAGIGGIMSANGTSGGITTLTDNDGMFHSAKSGNSGIGPSDDNSIGGQGGVGFPAGLPGDNGKSSGVGSTESAANGGTGGNNGSAYGNGGTGGSGSRINNSTMVQADPGQGGGSGYAKIVYTYK